MALYKYVDIEVLKHIINGSIRFTQPGAFNDPFEILPEIYVPENFDIRSIEISFDIRGTRRAKNIEKKIDFDPEFCSDIVSRQIRSSLNELIGILCLSKNPDSLLMWSHYANQYAGAVVEFDDKHEFFEDSIDVEYLDDRPVRHISDYIGEGQTIPISELCVKPKEWEYESEVRIVRLLSKCEKIPGNKKFPIYVLDIPKECIKSVILGERTSIKEQRDIWSIVKDTHISLSLAAISNCGYKFRTDIVKYGVPISEIGPGVNPRTAHIFSERETPLGKIARDLIEDHPMSKIVNDTV